MTELHNMAKSLSINCEGDSRPLLRQASDSDSPQSDGSMPKTYGSEQALDGGEDGERPLPHVILSPRSKSASIKSTTTCFVYLLSLLSAIGGFLFGYDTGVVSGAMIFLREEFHLNSLWQELVVSITIGTAAIFAFLGGFMNDWLGRKPVILVASFVFTVGAVVLGLAYNRVMLLAGRAIVGIGIGNTHKNSTLVSLTCQ